MSLIKVRTDNELLCLDQCPTLTSGNENIDYLAVEFGHEWEMEGVVYYASFFTDDPTKTIDIELVDGQCKIPNQVLAQPGKFHFGVWAEADGQKVKTSDIIEYPLKQGINGTNNAGAPVIEVEYWYERREESWI